jgi:hypothetical protein
VSKHDKGVRWNMDQLLDHLKNNPSLSQAKAERLIRDAQASGSNPAAAALRALATDGLPVSAPVRRVKGGVRSASNPRSKGDTDSLSQLLTSVKHANIQVHASWFPNGAAQELVLWFEGARILTLNRMISLLTNPKSAVKGPYFSYKQQWKKRMNEAGQVLLATYGRLPVFVHPVTIEVMRHAPRLADRDSLAFMFKIHIDALRSKHLQIIRDDNPNEVVDVIPHQLQVNPKKGTLGVGLRLKAQPDWIPPPVPDVAAWLRRSDR